MTVRRKPKAGKKSKFKILEIKEEFGGFWPSNSRRRR
jgi:hypothetical protein